jgi:hypothetical protein
MEHCSIGLYYDGKMIVEETSLQKHFPFFLGRQKKKKIEQIR